MILNNETLLKKERLKPVEKPTNDKIQVQQAFKQWMAAKNILESHYRVSSRHLSFKIPLFDAFKEKLGETREKWWWDHGPFLFWMNMNPESLFFTLELGPIEADKRVLLMETLKERGISFSKKGLTLEAKFNRIHSETISIIGLNDVELKKDFDCLYSNQDLQRILKILQKIYDIQVSSME